MSTNSRDGALAATHDRDTRRAHHHAHAARSGTGLNAAAVGARSEVVSRESGGAAARHSGRSRFVSSGTLAGRLVVLTWRHS